MKVIVSTAIELSTAQQADIAKKLKTKLDKSASFDFGVDDSLIGGLVVKIDSNEVDGSVKRKLQLIKETLYQQL